LAKPAARRFMADIVKAAKSKCEAAFSRRIPPLSTSRQRNDPTMMEATLPATPLLDQVRGAFSNSPHLTSRQVQVEATGGNVRLQGTVSSFYQKQMAQELARRVDGVQNVVNQLQVNWG